MSEADGSMPHRPFVFQEGSALKLSVKAEYIFSKPRIQFPVDSWYVMGSEDLDPYVKNQMVQTCVTSYRYSLFDALGDAHSTQ